MGTCLRELWIIPHVKTHRLDNHEIYTKIPYQMYQKKYYSTFISIDGKTNVVEIWQNTTDTITATELIMMAVPFKTIMPAISGKFQPVRGSGCEINYLSRDNMTLFNSLYHADPFEFMVKHYVNGVINWIGYLNSEMQAEPYSFDGNYPVQVLGNDGFALMDRYQFLQSNGAIYTGVKSMFEILQIILSKIALPYTDIRISLATTFDGMGSDTILHNTYIDCGNYYDEDGIAATLRKVLESILLPFGTFAVQIAGGIVITDIHSIASNSTMTYSRYDLSGNYMGIVSGSNRKTLSSIGYKGTGSDIERSGGKNKQVVKYAPYPVESFLPNSISTSDEFQTRDLVYSPRSNIYYQSLTGNKYWSGSGFEVTRFGFDPIVSYATRTAFPSVGEENKTYQATDTGYQYRWNNYTYAKIDDGVVYGKPENIHLRVVRSTTNNLIARYQTTSVISLPKGSYTGTEDVKVTKGSGLMIKGKIGIVTSKFQYAQGEVTADFSNIYLYLKIKIGNYYFNGVNWTTDDSFYMMKISGKNNEIISTRVDYLHSDHFDLSKYSDLPMFNIGIEGADGILIPVTQDLSGVLSVEIYSFVMRSFLLPPNYETVYDKNDSDIIQQGFREYWLNNVSLNIVQEDGTTITTGDVEYQGYLDLRYKDEADKVELICGTSARISDRGKMMWINNGTLSALTSWTRASNTAKIEELLLASLSSNYRAGYIRLTNLKLANSFTPINILTDTYTGSALLMVESATVNYRDNEIECELIEVSPDELIIQNI